MIEELEEPAFFNGLSLANRREGFSATYGLQKFPYQYFAVISYFSAQSNTFTYTILVSKS
jgi:hypothetical protein